MIPKHIYMTYKHSNIPHPVIDQWKLLNPNYKIHFYKDQDCINFIHKHYGHNYVNYFNELKRGAYKADLWRLCVLYILGGVYVDIDLIPCVPIKTIIGNSTFCTCLSALGCGNSIFQAFIASTKKNPIIKKCIDDLYSKRYNNKFWNIINAPTKSIMIVLKDILNVSNIRGNTYYYVNKIKFVDELHIGTCSKYIKKIKMKKNYPSHSILNFSNKLINNKFQYRINNNTQKIEIKRIDGDTRWNSDLWAKIVYYKYIDNRIKILQETTDPLMNNSRAKFYVSYENKVLFWSHNPILSKLCLTTKILSDYLNSNDGVYLVLFKYMIKNIPQIGKSWISWLEKNTYI